MGFDVIEGLSRLQSSLIEVLVKILLRQPLPFNLGPKQNINFFNFYFFCPDRRTDRFNGDFLNERCCLIWTAYVGLALMLRETLFLGVFSNFVYWEFCIVGVKSSIAAQSVFLDFIYMVLVESLRVWVYFAVASFVHEWQSFDVLHTYFLIAHKKKLLGKTSFGAVLGFLWIL